MALAKRRFGLPSSGDVGEENGEPPAGGVHTRLVPTIPRRYGRLITRRRARRHRRFELPLPIADGLDGKYLPRHAPHQFGPVSPEHLLRGAVDVDVTELRVHRHEALTDALENALDLGHVVTQLRLEPLAIGNVDDRPEHPLAGRRALHLTGVAEPPNVPVRPHESGSRQPRLRSLPAHVRDGHPSDHDPRDGRIAPTADRSWFRRGREIRRCGRTPPSTWRLDCESPTRMPPRRPPAAPAAASPRCRSALSRRRVRGVRQSAARQLPPPGAAR